LGNPVEVHRTAGQASDIGQAETLLGDHQPQAVIGDKGYDRDAFAARIEQRQAQVVIPPRSNRKQPREHDRHRYKSRSLVECFIGCLKRFRRVATRYEKKAKNFLSFVHLACIIDLLASFRPVV
jgi:transposase